MMRGVAAKYRHYCLMLVDADEGYEWGKENPYGTDCSGTICYPLMRMGYKIRTTADELYRKLFTITPRNDLDLEKVMAVFYVMQKAWTKLSGELMPAGSVRHVTPVVGRYVVVDADYSRDQIVLKTAKEVRLEVEAKGAVAVWKELNWESVKRYDGKLYYSPDPEVLAMMGEEI